ncbi:hypothetical protein AB0A73_17320 [Glycomyces sp. NPDC047369]
MSDTVVTILEAGAVVISTIGAIAQVWFGYKTLRFQKSAEHRAGAPEQKYHENADS